MRVILCNPSQKEINQYKLGYRAFSPKYGTLMDNVADRDIMNWNQSGFKTAHCEIESWKAQELWKSVGIPTDQEFYETVGSSEQVSLVLCINRAQISLFKRRWIGDLLLCCDGKQLWMGLLSEKNIPDIFTKAIQIKSNRDGSILIRDPELN